MAQRREAALPAQILGLQRRAGNQATSRLLGTHTRLQRFAAGPGIESYVNGARGGGQPLPAAARARFESGLGFDLSDVRIHASSRAARAAADIHAQAFTIGSDIHFAAGHFAPGTASGDRLLAHELTHVVQQSGAADTVQRQTFPDPLGDLPESDVDCSINLQAGKLRDFVNCCAKTPLGRGCSKDVIDGVCKIIKCDPEPPPERLCPPGFKAGRTKEHKGQCCKEPVVAENDRVCCDPKNIVLNSVNPRCCPAGTEPDVAKKNCVTPAPPVTPCLPGQKNSKGECCLLPTIPHGDKCVVPTPLPKPKPAPALVPLELFFQKDKPPLSGKGTIANSLTDQGRANFTKLVALLESDAALKVQLVGKASPEGSDDYNLELGSRRAELIAAALADAGIDASRLAKAPGGEPAGCQELREGVFTCGELGATGARDRQVLAEAIRPAP
jgi:hypothetical protein